MINKQYTLVVNGAIMENMIKPAGYTIEQYITDCDYAGADEEWMKMLLSENPKLEEGPSIRWCNDRSIEVVLIDGKAVALAGWNGEAWLDCWICKTICNDTAYDYENEKKIKVRPIYRQVDENAFEIAEYEIV